MIHYKTRKDLVDIRIGISPFQKSYGVKCQFTFCQQFHVCQQFNQFHLCPCQDCEVFGADESERKDWSPSTNTITDTNAKYLEQKRANI